MMMRLHPTIAVFCLLAVAIAGCSSMQEKPAGIGTAGAYTIDQAMALLNEGKPEQARVLLVDMVSKTAPHSTASLLLAEIDKDPEAFLGQTFERYEVRPGDTMSDLAMRFAGDSRLFYALSRRNGLKAPNKLEAGAIIDVPVKSAIPAKPPAAASVVKAVEEVTTQSSKLADDNQASHTPNVPPADSFKSIELRRMALQHLNEGDVDQAVSLLQEARRLAPENDAVTADLARAERIQETVKKRTIEAPKTLH